MGAPDVLGHRLEQARLALGRAGQGIGRIVHTGMKGEPSAPLRVVRQRCLDEGQVELVVAPEIVLRLGNE